MRHSFLSLLILIAVAGCAKKEQAPAAPIRIEPVTGSPAYPNASLKIISPREGQELKDPKDSVFVVMQVAGMELGKHTDADSTKGIAYSKQGQHIHVIIDDKPYMANYVNGQPFNVGVLAPGLHTIRAFPSYSWHESIKSDSAFAARTFYVGPAQGKSDSVALAGPMLTYSRPKGTYSGADTSKVLLDFYVSNAKLAANGYHVNVWIDDSTMPAITQWQPYYISGLSKGKHTIKLQLVAPNGSAVPGAFNNPKAEITLQ